MRFVDLIDKKSTWKFFDNGRNPADGDWFCEW